MADSADRATVWSTTFRSSFGQGQVVFSPGDAPKHDLPPMPKMGTTPRDLQRAFAVLPFDQESAAESPLGGERDRAARDKPVASSSSFSPEICTSCARSSFAQALYSCTRPSSSPGDASTPPAGE